MTIKRRKLKLFALIDSRGGLYTNRLGDTVLFPTKERAAAVANREMREEASVIYIVTDGNLSFRVVE